MQQYLEMLRVINGSDRGEGKAPLESGPDKEVSVNGYLFLKGDKEKSC